MMSDEFLMSEVETRHGIYCKTAREVINYMGLGTTFYIVYGGWCAYIIKEDDKYYFCGGINDGKEEPWEKYEITLDSPIEYWLTVHSYPPTSDTKDSKPEKPTNITIKQKLFEKVLEANKEPSDMTVTFTYEELKNLWCHYQFQTIEEVS